MLSSIEAIVNVAYAFRIEMSCLGRGSIPIDIVARPDKEEHLGKYITQVGKLEFVSPL